MTSTSRSIAATVDLLRRQGHDRLGLPLPADLAADLDHADALAASADTLRPTRQAIAEAVRAAVAAGKDPASDRTCQRLATASTLASLGAGDALAAEADALRLRALATHADELTRTWRGRFDPAAVQVARAVAECPGIPLDAGAHVGALRAPQLEAWHAGRAGLHDIETITSLWQIVMTNAKLANVGAPWTRPLIAAELDARTADKVGPTAKPGDLAAAGVPLSLATPAEHAERVEALHQSQESRDLAAEQAQQDARGSAFRHGPGRRPSLLV